MARKGGLGRGLEALIPGSDIVPQSGNLTFIRNEKITPNPRQPRRNFDPEELKELTASVLMYGVLQPLIISPGIIDGEYVLIAGERRLQAARLAGLDSVPVVIRVTTDMEKLELALIENVQRADLNPLEEAEGYHQLADEFDLSHEEIAQKVGKSRVAVSNTLRLLKLPINVKNALIEERISAGHARALLALATSESQTAVLKTILSQELNVRQTEELVKKYGGERRVIDPKVNASPEVADLENKLRASLGTKVSLRSGKKGGSLTIYYYSGEELELIMGRLLNEKNSI
jgi:ParB family chromosome partitioning protein